MAAPAGPAPRLRKEAGEPVLWGPGSRAPRPTRLRPPPGKGTRARVLSITARLCTDGQEVTRERQSGALTRRLSLCLSVQKIFHKDYAWFSRSEKTEPHDKFCKLRKSHVYMIKTTNQAEKSHETHTFLLRHQAPPGRMPRPTLRGRWFQKLLHTFKHG